MVFTQEVAPRERDVMLVERPKTVYDYDIYERDRYDYDYHRQGTVRRPQLMQRRSSFDDSYLLERQQQYVRSRSSSSSSSRSSSRSSHRRSRASLRSRSTARTSRTHYDVREAELNERISNLKLLEAAPPPPPPVVKTAWPIEAVPVREPRHHHHHDHHDHHHRYILDETPRREYIRDDRPRREYVRERRPRVEERRPVVQPVYQQPIQPAAAPVYQQRALPAPPAPYPPGAYSQQPAYLPAQQGNIFSRTGKKAGNAAVWGAGFTAGADAVNSVLR